MTRPPRTQEDGAGLDIHGVIWDWAVVAQNVSWGCPNLFQLKKPNQDHPSPRTQEDGAGLDGPGVIWDWAVVAQNVPWGCPNLFQGRKPHQDHPPPCPILQGPRRTGLVLMDLESSRTG